MAGPDIEPGPLVLESDVLPTALRDPTKKSIEFPIALSAGDVPLRHMFFHAFLTVAKNKVTWLHRLHSVI